MNAQPAGADAEFALRVRGDSMVDEGILDGDYVLVRPGKAAPDGTIVVAVHLLADGGGERGAATLKRFFKEKNRFRLEPANKTMKPIFRDKVDIIGILVGVVRKY